MYLTDPPITTALLLVGNFPDLEETFGPRIIRIYVRDHDGLNLGLFHDTIMASLPSYLHEMLGSATISLVGSLCMGLAKHDTSATAH